MDANRILYDFKISLQYFWPEMISAEVKKKFFQGKLIFSMTSVLLP